MYMEAESEPRPVSAERLLAALLLTTALFQSGPACGRLYGGGSRVTADFMLVASAAVSTVLALASEAH